jgi:hypothetical protein
MLLTIPVVQLTRNRDPLKDLPDPAKLVILKIHTKDSLP